MPADLLAITGRRELVRALGTSDPKVAHRLGARIRAHVYELFAMLRSPLLTDAQKRRLVREFYERELSADESARIISPMLPGGVDALSFWRSCRPHLEAELREHSAIGETALITWSANDIIAREGLSIEPGSASYRELCHALIRGWLEVTRRAIERDKGDWSGEPADPIVRRAATLHVVREPEQPSTKRGREAHARAISPDGLKPLRELLPLMHAERSITDLTAREHRIAVEMIEEFFGRPKPVCEITKLDIVEYKKLLLQSPTNRKQRFPGLTIPEAAKANQARTAPFETLDARTINDKWLSHIKAILTWAVNNSAIPDNPAAGVRVEAGKSHAGGKPRYPFSQEQLKKIFSAPPFNADGPRDEKFWVPVVALFSAARSDELGQLEVSDVVKVDGVWCMRISTQSDYDDAGKGTKTESSERLVPIHRQLIELGFVDYVGKLKEKGTKRVFPGWEPDRLGRYSSTLPRWFNRTFLPKIGAKTAKTSFHSFRHNAKDAMRNAGIDEEARDAICGHTPGTVGRTYGTGFSVSKLAELLDRVCYDCLDLRRLTGSAGEKHRLVTAAGAESGKDAA